MPFQIVRNDITKMKVDAIVNAANSTLLGGGGVDGAIHRAAGKMLLMECKHLGGCDVGDAKITKGYKLPAKYVIHTVGPVWTGGKKGEEKQLESCYKASLRLAAENGIGSIAFPLISSGVYGYPKRAALDVATRSISDFLDNNDMMVYLVIFDADTVAISSKLYNDIKQFIDDNYVDEYAEPFYSRSLLDNCCDESFEAPTESCLLSFEEALPTRPVERKHIKRVFSSRLDDVSVDASSKVSCPQADIDDIIKSTIDESFAEMLLRKIDEIGMKDSECYKKANIDKSLFSKIRSNKTYKPNKATVVAFAIALELDINEARELLMKAGYALSHSNIFDIIVEYFILNGNYNIFEINEALFSYDQVTLGSK